MIPKTIHFIWLGNSRKPSNFAAVLKSWETWAPQFTLREWREKDAAEFDLPAYYYRALQAKQYAFASDVLRFHILERYGGIYMDVDEMLIRSIDTNELLHNTAFLAKYHESEDYFGFGAIGSVPKSAFSRKMIDYFKKAPDDRYVIVNKVGSQIASSLNSENPNEITIFPQEYFYPLDEDSINETTYGKHLSNTSWIPSWKKIVYKMPFYSLIKRIVLRVIPRKRIQNVEY